MTKRKSKFIKHDSGKIRPSLVPAEAYVNVIKVFEYGARKYTPNNWRNGTSSEDIARYIDAIERHLLEVKMGNLFDSESGISHMAHIATNAIIYEQLMIDKNRSHPVSLDEVIKTFQDKDGACE